MAPRRPALTLGVEEEYLLVDPATRDLVADQPAGFMACCQEALGEQVTYELLQSQIEIGTVVCQNVQEIRADLQRLRRTVAEIARAHGMRMIAVSTHPSASWDHQHNTDRDRYRLLTQDFQVLAWRLLVSGMHVHAGIEDGDLRVDLMGQATYFLPHLLALSSSSPFWQGRDTGMKSYRPTVFGDLPRSGLPETFESYREWQRLVETMAATGVCDDATKIWWDVRPSWKQPTLELRITDICTRLEDAVTIAALWQSILALLWRLRESNQSWRGYRRVLIQENKWRAQRWGVGGTLADYGRQTMVPFAELIDELVEMLRPEAESLGCLAEVEHAREIVAQGSSADKQLAVHQEALAAGATPVEASRAVVDWLIDATIEGIPS